MSNSPSPTSLWVRLAVLGVVYVVLVTHSNLKGGKRYVGRLSWPMQVKLPHTSSIPRPIRLQSHRYGHRNVRYGNVLRQYPTGSAQFQNQFNPTSQTTNKPRNIQPKSRRRIDPSSTSQPNPVSFPSGNESDPEYLYTSFLTQAIRTMESSNRRAVEALVGGKVDWMDSEQVEVLRKRMEQITIRDTAAFWKFCQRTKQPLTVEIARVRNLRVQALIVPVGESVTWHYPPGSFLMQKTVRGRGQVRSLIYSKAARMTNEVARRDTEPNPSPWVFYGGPLRNFQTTQDCTTPLVLLEVLITPPGRPVSLSPNHTRCALVSLPNRKDQRNPQLDNHFNTRVDAHVKRHVDKQDEIRMERKERRSLWASDLGVQQPNEAKMRGVDTSNVEKRVGGVSMALHNITRRILASRNFPPGFMSQLDLLHVRGLILYGPPGCGKTLLARELGRTLNARSISIVSGSEILSKFVGDAEKTLRGLFRPAEMDQARYGESSGLHVIIMDEFDAVFKCRGSVQDGGVRDSVTNQLLAKMDGVEPLNNILVVGLTNRLELIDPALLRPGRFEVKIEINPPDHQARQEILSIHLKSLLENGGLDSHGEWLYSSGQLASQTERFTGADLAGVVRSATSFALQRAIQNNMQNEPISVLGSDLIMAILEIREHINQESNQRPWRPAMDRILAVLDRLR